MKKELSEALDRARKIADQNQAEILQFSQISRADRELLIRLGWLQEIIRGWYMLVRPDISTGDSVSWYANFWDFLKVYLESRFGINYCLSAESSLDIHLDVPTIPKQVIVIVAEGGGKSVNLPFNTSILPYSDKKNIPQNKVKIKGIWVTPLPLALCKASPTFFTQSPKEAEIALKMIREPSEISSILITHDMKRAAARMLGAYEFLGDDEMVKAIEEDLLLAGIKVVKENPFDQPEPLISILKVRSPYVARIQALWKQGRTQIIDFFPEAPMPRITVEEFLMRTGIIYTYDAYNSLSIEGYRVTPELIEKVKNDGWNPQSNTQDSEDRNALAARGYFEAHQVVIKTVEKILTGGSPGLVVKSELQNWYRTLFVPFVRAGIITPTQLLGYRRGKVFIKNSRHTPLPHEAILDAMDAFFDCLINEPHAGVRAVLGHYLFVFIHPYIDGNGRISRFLMNAMLASGGYNWTVIQMANRTKYLDALDKADVDQDMIPFTKLIISEMKASDSYLTQHKQE